MTVILVSYFLSYLLYIIFDKMPYYIGPSYANLFLSFHMDLSRCVFSLIHKYVHQAQYSNNLFDQVLLTEPQQG